MLLKFVQNCWNASNKNPVCWRNGCFTSRYGQSDIVLQGVVRTPRCPLSCLLYQEFVDDMKARKNSWEQVSSKVLCIRLPTCPKCPRTTPSDQRHRCTKSNIKLEDLPKLVQTSYIPTSFLAVSVGPDKSNGCSKALLDDDKLTSTSKIVFIYLPAKHFKFLTSWWCVCGNSHYRWLILQFLWLLCTHNSVVSIIIQEISIKSKY